MSVDNYGKALIDFQNFNNMIYFVLYMYSSCTQIFRIEEAVGTTNVNHWNSAELTFEVE